MSINVTVKGNPVSIKRGKMVTADPDQARKEFQKRRRMRLQQVRQQSKDIAQDVRDKVKKEKTKQLSNVEKDGANKLKEWQNKKLLQLQNQYEECLKNIGLGHTLATVEEDEEEKATVTSKINEQIAKERGQKAAALLQIDKNDKNMKEAIPQQRKKIAKEIEKTRSAMVTKLHKDKSKKRKTKNTSDSVNVSIESSSSDSDVPMLHLSSSANEDVTVIGPTETSKPTCSPRCPSSCSSPRENVPSPPSIPPITRQEFVYDDRISHHIRQRILKRKQEHVCQLDKENFVNCHINAEKSRNDTQITHNGRTVHNKTQTCSGSRVNFQTEYNDCLPCRKDNQIPYKPTVSLKDAKSSERSSHSRVEKVVYYDHSNRYTKQCPAEDNVEKIPPENIEIHPKQNELDEYLSKAYKRDREAEIRGQAALEKEKIARDYEDMLRQLPVLQKQERIASIKNHDPTIHLSDDRQKEQNALRQNRMENQYDKINLPVPPIITIPPISYGVANPINPCCKCDNKDEAPELNLANWDVVEESVPKQQPKVSVESLEKMLDKLKEQRDKIMNEMGVLPKNSQLYKLINELENAKCDKKQEKPTRSRDKRGRTRKSQEEVIDSSSSSTPPVKKKSKSKTKHNMETQTTPRTRSFEKVDKSTNVDPVVEEPNNKNDFISCLCKDNPIKDDEKQTKDMEKICEIVIKIKEDNEPEILVSPKKNEICVKTDTVFIDRKKPKEIETSAVDVAPKSKPDTINNSTSTSYLSLPDFKDKPNALKKNLKCYKPCPTSLKEREKRKLDPRLVVYIKKLLSLSHKSIETLGVSSSSDVTTPGDSIVQSYINNPMAQLKNVMKFYNLSSEDLANLIKTDAKKDKKTNISGTSTAISLPPNQGTILTASLPSFSEVTQLDVDVPDPTMMSAYDYSMENYPDIMLKYAEIAENCHQRISNLTALIEKVRQEKQEILRNPNSSASDKENSTSYLNLPTKFLSGSKDTTTTSSLNSDTEDVVKKILEIDYSLAEKLKMMSTKEINDLYSELRTTQERNNNQNTTDEIAQRYNRLLGVSDNKQTNIDIPDFVPMLLDIKDLPKLPQVETKAQSYNVELIKSTKRPPPSKAFMAAKRVNNDIGLPHQLSTIIEADSVTSTKPKAESSSSRKAKPKSNKQTSLQATDNILALDLRTAQTETSESSTDKSDLENMEAMLRNLGMGWAVATLRKTQEALAQTSSSSSLDINISQSQVKITESSTSSINLKTFLEQQLIKSMSGSKETSTLDVTNFMKEIEQLSVSRSSGENKQRTSTPIQSTRSNEKSKTALKFSEESDMSSVKSNADVNFFSLLGSSKNSNFSNNQ